MELLTKILRSQLSLVNKLSDSCCIKNSRAVQDKLGSIMAHEYLTDVTYHAVDTAEFQGEYIIPNNRENDGVILYLHGGGYCSGDMQYAKGFGTILAAQENIDVCCTAYRLAPENPFPAALDDATSAYRRLLKDGYSPEKIILCGESAGGGLVFSLALRLKEENLPMPCGIIAISPWSDLTMSGISYEKNRENDPSMTLKRLRFYAEQYTENASDPLVSPLFGDLEGLPPSLIFVGGDEIMLSDSVELHKKLIDSGCVSNIRIAPDMWHIYLLYGIKEAKEDRKLITDFLKEVLYGGA